MKSAGSLHLDSSLYPEQETEHENMNESHTVEWYHAYSNIAVDELNLKTNLMTPTAMKNIHVLFAGKPFLFYCVRILQLIEQKPM